MTVGTFFPCFGFCLPLLGALKTSQLLLNAVLRNLRRKRVVKRFQPSGNSRCASVETSRDDEALPRARRVPVL